MHVLKIHTFAFRLGEASKSGTSFQNLRWYHFRGFSDIHVQIRKDFKVEIVLNK